MNLNDMDKFKILLVGLFLLGLVFYIIAGRLKYKASKYEFENMSDGGVVQFDSFKNSNKHQNKGCLVQFLGGLGMLLMGGSGIFLAFLFGMGK